MINRSLFLLFCLLSGCAKPSIHVVQDYIDKTNLASSFTQTPDPDQRCPPTGQRLLIRWQADPACEKQPVMLHLKVIYRSLEEQSFDYPLCGDQGEVEHLLLGERYCSTRGLFTYKVELLDPEGCTLSSWQHRMWVKLIRPEGEESGPWHDLLEEPAGCEGQCKDQLENGLDRELGEFAHREGHPVL